MSEGQESQKLIMASFRLALYTVILRYNLSYPVMSQKFGLETMFLFAAFTLGPSQSSRP